MDAVLNAILRGRFLGFSYGCRPKRKPARALGRLIPESTAQRLKRYFDATSEALRFCQARNG